MPVANAATTEGGGPVGEVRNLQQKETGAVSGIFKQHTDVPSDTRRAAGGTDMVEAARQQRPPQARPQADAPTPIPEDYGDEEALE